MVRGKFKLDVITKYACGTKCFNFNAVSPADGEIEENAKYHKYTPSGKVEMVIDNPAAQMQFALGEYYYLDFTPCVATK